ncbi:arylsulfatase B-like [Ixodes scapularis]|uniref:arylsulfatase B-like n=1 Tax=Ixodes scapularis TaxID=6945 RepID=UPI001A9E93A8|nr:arylsulfatase B-like [Ixodes scapularis]
MRRAIISTWAYARQLLTNNERPQEISMLLTLVGLYFFACRIPQKSSMPNIIFILADDLGWDDVSFHGSPQIPTPNMDALAADGIILNQHYAQALCTPSRAALMTGRYPIHTGMQHFVIQPGEPWGLPLEYRLMPEFFRDLGYKTHMVGKWHLGSFTKDFIPVRRGFDSFYGFYNADQDYYNKTLTEGEHTGYDFWLNEDIHIYPNNRYSTHHYTERAVSLIRSHNPSQPLFLYLSYQAPHVGTGPSLLEAPDENVNKFLYIPEKNRTTYAGAYC